MGLPISNNNIHSSSVRLLGGGYVMVMVYQLQIASNTCAINHTCVYTVHVVYTSTIYLKWKLALSKQFGAL